MRHARRSLTVIALVAAVVTALAGCSSSGGTGSKAGTGLPHGRSYVGGSVTENGQARPLVPGTLISVGFTDTEVVYDAGCNQATWPAQVTGGKLEITADDEPQGPVGCDGRLDAQARWLEKFVASTPTLAVAGDTLTLTAGATTVTLTDRDKAKPGQVLVGARWVVDVTIVPAKDSAQGSWKPVPVGTVTSFAFGDDGKLTANTGCRKVTATWTSTPDLITTVSARPGKMTFDAVTVPKRKCPAKTAAVDRAVVAALKGTVSAGVVEGYLTIIAESGAGLRLIAK